MKNKNNIYLFWWLLALVLMACTPEEGNKKAKCEAGSSFDPLSRVCVKDASDGSSDSATDTNKAPVGTLREITISEDSPQATQFLTYTDADGDFASSCSIIEDDPFNIISLALITGVTCKCAGYNCFILLKPELDKNGVAGLRYRITDSKGKTSAEQSVSVIVTPVNDAPFFEAVYLPSYTVPTPLLEAYGSNPVTSLNFALPQATDVDSNVSSIYYQLYSSPAKGYVTNCMGQSGSLLTDLSCTYTPNDSDVDVGDTFSYTACDGLLCSDPLPVNITITPINDPPKTTSASEVIWGYEDATNSSSTSFTYNITSITDPDSTDLIFQLLTGPSFGTVSFNNKALTYKILDGNVNDANVQSKYGRSTIDNIVFRACDTNGLCSSSVSGIISIVAQNDAPSVDVFNLPLNWVYASSTVSLTYSASESSTYTATQYNVTLPAMRDAEVDGGEGGSLTYSYTLESGIQGTLNEVSFTGGSPYFKYTPSDGNFVGVVKLFKYKAYDGNKYSPEYSVSINITEVNDEPVVCEYTLYEEANECGQANCLGVQSPIGKITPSKAGIYYFDYVKGLCYQSTSSQGWEVIPGSYISNQTINEGDEIRMHNLRVDEGGGTAESDSQNILISNIKSSDLNLVKPENILFYYGSEANLRGTGLDAIINLGDDVTNSASQDFIIKIVPNKSNYGLTVISFDLSDNGVEPRVTGKISFNVTINPVSAAHKGWKNIKVLGPMVNNQGEIRDTNTVCDYSRTACNGGGACLGLGDPTTLAVVAGGLYAIYYDKTNNKCYYSSGTSPNYTWHKFTSERYQNPSQPTDNHYLLCNISSVEASPECETLGSEVRSCMGDTSPVSLMITPTRRNTFFYDKTNDRCYRSTGDVNEQQWQAYDTTGSVELSWEPLVVYGNGSISGYNVYRRTSNELFNYDVPINKTVISSLATSFVDNAQNSWVPPVPQTVYFYELRPIIGGIPTDITGLTKTVRVLVPPPNRAFIHRWMANKTICKAMGQTSDLENNYRCSYMGPSDVQVGSATYFDVQNDFVVDRYEAGCNYSRPIDCRFDDDPFNDKACIGLINPNNEVTAGAGKIFYNRRNGVCYVNTNGNQTWDAIYNHTNPSVIAYIPNGGHSYAELPPISQISQDESYRYCKRQTISGVLGASSLATSFVGITPSRSQQIIYSWWGDADSDTDLTTMESGFSMNASSKCNSSSAHGVSENYNDDRIPASPVFYTLPATESFQDQNGVNVRSVITGSDLTKSCSSRFGVQDGVGNLSEWSLERLFCSALGCRSTSYSVDGVAVSDKLIVGGTSDYDTFWLNDETVAGVPTFKGPCNDLLGIDTECNGELTTWPVEEEMHSATRFLLPVGLPVHERFITQYPNDPMKNYVLQIGPVAGISTAKLHEDAFVFNTSALNSAGNTGAYGGFANGGSYLSGSGAGQWYLETVPLNSNLSINRRPDLGFRCVYPVGASNYEE
ncbi:MAG: hypothetical protein A2381_05875 [Bdellovibrionales bacterium RIFOXYB1_FULL_37_110]|nr:MAG: hypothetical protein A2417_04760 [Bdellovibrionales bacterium RIFOXYC1_FULL_37_79]OFZ59349.1 MAG: hypothetical protein A2381_05875 [Bdellovibrionales bacterium RIFOXYB1_FULL_37_110]OFZ61909.1 MAG: hypothetical protein A2577_17760 [Bdellovibrionales bacterium RIFOXYD1_FULL_36_51]